MESFDPFGSALGYATWTYLYLFLEIVLFDFNIYRVNTYMLHIFYCKVINHATNTSGDTFELFDFLGYKNLKKSHHKLGNDPNRVSG